MEPLILTEAISEVLELVTHGNMNNLLDLLNTFLILILGFFMIALLIYLIKKIIIIIELIRTFNLYFYANKMQ